jgi:hydroxymethylpyrimidine kinase / phosphomethylpyrimidine kinase / thiamine-phosphate diphosphorylase
MNARTVVLTIGGSDSGGGAGIQADLKTFSALGVHGTSAITAVTAQNTLGVKEVFPMESMAVLSQMEAVLSDFEISWAVTGMLPTAGVVNAVADASEKYGLNLVVDPVIKAEAGGRLFSPEAVAALKERLIPIARIITPNIFEARNLTGIQVKDLVSAEEAARAILDMGAGAAVVKGGHLDCTDLLLQGGAPELIRGRREQGGNHGVGCTYSSALTAFLAMGLALRDAATKAQSFSATAVRYSPKIGRGPGPVDQAGALREEAERFRVLSEVTKAADILQVPEAEILAPEKGMSIGMALEGASSLEDVASAEVILSEDLSFDCARFGRRSSTALALLDAVAGDSSIRAALSISPDIPDNLKKAMEESSAAITKGPNLWHGPVLIQVPGGEEPRAMLLGGSALHLARCALAAAKIRAH